MQQNEDKTLVTIELIDGEKYIHYSGYGYYNGEPVDKPYRWVDYTFLMCPLATALTYGVKEYEADYQDSVKQYVSDLSEAEYKDIMREEKYPVLSGEDISANTPCGTYWLRTEAQTSG